VLTRETLLIYTQDGERFLTFTEIKQRADDFEQQAEEWRDRADEARKRADDAERRADDAQKRVDEERRARERLLAQLQEKGIDISALGIGDA
jgi:uncharacterized coiled-coil DUF342 family protein